VKLGFALSVAQHSLFLSSRATVLSAAPRQRRRAGGFSSRRIDAEQARDPSN
jgi:hypothetical protein